jgi:hypothetical protein
MGKRRGCFKANTAAPLFHLLTTAVAWVQHRCVA